MADTKDAEFAAGAAVTAAATCFPSISGTLTSLVTQAGAVSGPAKVGAAITTLVPAAAPVIAVVCGIYAIYRLCKTS